MRHIITNEAGYKVCCGCTDDYRCVVIPLHEGRLYIWITAVLYLQLNQLVNVLPSPYREDFLHCSTEIHSYILLSPTLKTIIKFRT